MATTDLTPDQAIDALRKLDEGQQRLVLGQLPPEILKAVRMKLEGPSVDFTANPKGEGLYRMSNKAQAREGDPTTYLNAGPGDEIPVPYSKVQDALGAGYRLHFDEKPRYYEDRANVGVGQHSGSAPGRRFSRQLEQLVLLRL